MHMKFLVDSMCGRLARFLRIFGYDTVYANDLEEYFSISPVPDNKLLEYAIEDDRIIITRDFPFYKKAKERCVYLEGEGVYNYLKQLQLKLNLAYNFIMEQARCSVCNSHLDKVIDKSSIRDDVQDETYKHYDDFHRCKNSNCRKVFWRGTHIEDIIKKLKEKVDLD